MSIGPSRHAPWRKNGLGMAVADVEVAVSDLIETFDLLLDEAGIFDHWRALVVANQVKGKVSHDARLVAAMQWHGISRILTFNTADFSRFAGVQALTPAEVLAGLMV